MSCIACYTVCPHLSLSTIHLSFSAVSSTTCFAWSFLLFYLSSLLFVYCFAYPVYYPIHSSIFFFFCCFILFCFFLVLSCLLSAVYYSSNRVSLLFVYCCLPVLSTIHLIVFIVLSATTC